eukprot:XP_008657585.1 uncharacterized protein LOC103637101 [Zea mays]
MVKEDEKASKKTKTTSEPKVTVSKKRKPEVLEPKVTEATEETPTPSAAEIAEILKKKDEPSATKTKVEGQKKRRIIKVMQAIEQTPLLALSSKIVPSPCAKAAAEAEMSAEAAAAAEAANLATTLSGIDKLLLDMAAEETASTAEKVMAAVPDKGKKIADATSEEKKFDLRNLVGQELSEAKKKELQEYGISCGY